MDALLTTPTVKMRDAAAVDEKLSNIIAQGTEKLLVITDFDYTLSRFHDSSGRKCWTTHDVFDGAGSVTNTNFGTTFARLKAKYLPIEFDPQMSVAEKTPHMEKWWRTAQDHIVREKLTRNSLEICVRDSEIELREEADLLISTLRSQNVPLVVFSAGIGNVIDIYLRNFFGKMPENVHIVSNMMNFDDDGIVKNFSEPLIHTFCKNSSVLRSEHTFFQNLSDRTSIILMGDSLGDAHMDVGIGGEWPALKIGFLNFNVEMLLEKYMAVYDIVLVDDQTMTVPLKLVSAICSNRANESLFISISDTQMSPTLTNCRRQLAEKNLEDNSTSNKKDKVGVQLTFDVKA